MGNECSSVISAIQLVAARMYEASRSNFTSLIKFKTLSASLNLWLEEEYPISLWIPCQAKFCGNILFHLCLNPQQTMLYWWFMADLIHGNSLPGTRAADPKTCSTPHFSKEGNYVSNLRCTSATVWGITYGLGLHSKPSTKGRITEKWKVLTQRSQTSASSLEPDPLLHQPAS